MSHILWMNPLYVQEQILHYWPLRRYNGTISGVSFVNHILESSPQGSLMQEFHFSTEVFDGTATTAWLQGIWI